MITLRSVKGSRLTQQEMDANFSGLADGSLLSPSAINFNPTATGLNFTQPAELTPSSLIDYTWATSGEQHFHLHEQSYSNLGGGAGTYNHASFYGFNVGRHSGLNVTPSKPSLIMGMEDNYYDAGGINNFAMEWYVEYYSPDGSSVQGLRPFYVGIPSFNNSQNHCVIRSDIGTDGSGSYNFLAGAGTQLLQLLPASVTAFQHFNAAGALAVNGSADRIAIGTMTTLPANANGSYVGWANGISGTAAGDILLVARSSSSCSIRFYTGLTTPVERFNFNVDGNFYATTDNVSDFGASGAARIRDFFLARTAYLAQAVAIPSGGSASAFVGLSSTASFGIYFGSGAPSVSAIKGSLYLRSDGSTINDRAYINTNGSTTWTPLTTVG